MLQSNTKKRRYSICASSKHPQTQRTSNYIGELHRNHWNTIGTWTWSHGLTQHAKAFCGLPFLGFTRQVPSDCPGTRVFKSWQICLGLPLESIKIHYTLLIVIHRYSSLFIIHHYSVAVSVETVPPLRREAQRCIQMWPPTWLRLSVASVASVVGPRKKCVAPTFDIIPTNICTICWLFRVAVGEILWIYFTICFIKHIYIYMIYSLYAIDISSFFLVIRICGRSRSLLVGGDGGASARDQLSHFKSGAWAPRGSP